MTDSEIIKSAKEKFKAKSITFYITNGTFKKYSSFFDLNKKSNYKIVCIDCVDSESTHRIATIDNMNIRAISAKHNDLQSDMSSVGFCFELEKYVLIYTGDTGFYEMENYYANLTKEFANKQIVLVANIGGFKSSENRYRVGLQDGQRAKCFYENHLIE